MIQKSSKPYLKIINGNWAETVDKDYIGAKKREWEASNGDKGVKWEVYYNNWTGTVQGITFKDTDWGETCTIELDDAYLSLNVADRYFIDLASKLCGADLKKSITFHPYDMEIDGKKKKGVSVQQNGIKLMNNFYDGNQNLGGFPQIDDAKKVHKSYWKIYFTEVSMFLIEQLKNLELTKPESAKPLEMSKSELDSFIETGIPSEIPDDLPF